MKSSDYIAHYLECRKVSHVFELVGGMITFLLDSLHRVSSIKIVSMHHEQGAGFAAEGYGRVKDVPGVAMATSGPGATNLLTAIGSCYFDSIPTVFITGQVNRHEQKGERAIRQLGFQETDIVRMAQPITKAAWAVNESEKLPEMLEAAFNLAVSGRPGPVLLDIPMDVQRAEVTDLSRLENFQPLDAIISRQITESYDSFWTNILQDLHNAKRPLILVGGGIRSAKSIAEFRTLCDALGVPVVHSLMAVDALPASHPLRVGFIGSYGNRWSNIALHECDFLLVLGSRLDVRQTGADTIAFKGERTIYHIDCEAGELNNRIEGCNTLVSELKPFLVAAPLTKFQLPDWNEWRNHLHILETKWPDTEEIKETPGINPNVVMRQISRISATDAVYVIDVGQHQMWAAQSLQLGSEHRFLTSGGMGAMGFALPAAIGACMGTNESQVIVIAGDGGFQLNIQELQTISRHQLPIKMIVINNHCHGMVRQFQESYFKGRFQSTVWGYSAPSFTDVAKAYKIDASTVSDSDKLSTALVDCFEDPARPYLLEVMIDSNANAYPKMAFGRPISEMEPFAMPLEMEGT